MRNILYALALIASPALAQNCYSLPGSVDDWTVEPAKQGTRTVYRVTVKPGRNLTPMSSLIGNSCFDFEKNPWSVKDGKFVPMFAVPASTTPVLVPSVEPVKRVTIEYASGRKEVVE